MKEEIIGAFRFHSVPFDRLTHFQEGLRTTWASSTILSEDYELLLWQASTDGLSESGAMIIYHKSTPIGFVILAWCKASIAGTSVVSFLPLNLHRNHIEKHHDIGNLLIKQFADRVNSAVLSLGANMRALKVWNLVEGVEYLPSMPRWWYIVSERKVRGMYKSHGKDWIFAVGSRANVKPEEWKDWEPGEAWDETFEKVLAPQIIGTWKDTSYINWRYVIHPRFKYHVKVPPSGNGLIVYRVAEILNEQREPTGYRALRVVDFLVPPEEGAAMGARLIQEAEATDCAFIDFYCSSVKFGQPLQEAGFSLGETMLPSLFSPLDFEFRPVSYGIRIQGISVHDPRLYLTRSDADQDRPN